MGDISDKHLHDLAFFAVEDIEPDVELSFDYIDAADDKGDNPMDVDREALTVCLCGSKDCRGYLW